MELNVGTDHPTWTEEEVVCSMITSFGTLGNTVRTENKNSVYNSEKANLVKLDTNKRIVILASKLSKSFWKKLSNNDNDNDNNNNNNNNNNYLIKIKINYYNNDNNNYYLDMG